ncbi:MAG TPA: DotU family type IV/VI secretion system protein [Bryobacteraceae bacterium]|jgi:type VI secretion system protein ImpK|nr:DotU family type IV/VI secretion system protein [Bryobacteraceae bacterium]
MSTTPQSHATPGSAEMLKRSDDLALIFQEVITVIERLRANRQQVTNAEAFRGQIQNALRVAEQDALRRGYGQEDVRVAVFAVVAFLDESILNSQNPMFADWPRRPLQLELFGVQIAGEIFFRNVERLLARQDSEPLADLLVVHQLCLLLGFRGKYGASGGAEIRNILHQMDEKIRRIRTITPPQWQVQAETVTPKGDRWLSILGWALIGCAVLALLLFIVFKFSLSSSAGQLSAMAAAATR